MTTVINFKIEQKIKTQAQEIAEAMGLNLSDVLNVYLRRFVKSKELHINLNKDESQPSDGLLAAVNEMRQDKKNGKLKSFKNLKSLTAYLAKV